MYKHTDIHISEDRVIQLLRSLISIKSPYFHEHEIMEFTKSWLNEHDIPAKIHRYFDDVATKFYGENVCGCIDSGKPGHTIYLGGHLDTVNLCEGWTKPKYEGYIEDGYMYGLGSLDMKSGCCAIMLALEEFTKNYKDTFTGKIIYQFVSDEEGPYGLGTVALIKDNVDGLRDSIDFAIIAEPSAAFTESVHPNICLGAKGGYNYTIKLHGKASHAAIPNLGINAVDDAAEVIRRLREIPPVTDKYLGKSLQCVISVKGGGNACSVPDYAEIEVFRHCVRGENINSIYNEVENAIKQADIKSQWEILFRQALSNEFDGGFIPFCTDPENEFLKTLIASTTKVCRREPSFSYFQSIGDFNHIGGLLSIPTVLFGADGDSFHSYDERVKIQSVVEISNSILEFLKYIHLNNGRKK